MRRLLCSMCTTMIILLSLYSTSFAAAGTERVILTPVSVESAGKYAMLKDTVSQVLTAKLSSDAGVVLVENSFDAEGKRQFLATYPKDSLETFDHLGADILAMPSLEQRDDGLVLEVRFYGAQPKPPLVLSETAKNDGEVLAALDRLSQRIDSKALASVSAPAASAMAQNKEGMDAFKTMHPEKLFKEKMFKETGAFASEDGKFAVGAFRSRKSDLQGELVGFSIADVDGNGSDEIVVATRTELAIYRYDRGVLRRLAVHELGTKQVPHAINVADIDGDGVCEIYLSAMRENDLSSTVYTWSPKHGFSAIMANIPWALRPVEIPGEGVVLLGQRKNVKFEPFLDPNVWVIDIDLKKQTTKRKEYFPVPRGINLFDFIYADVDGDGIPEKVCVTTGLNLVVLDTTDTPLWRSTEEFAAGLSYIGSRWRDQSSDANSRTSVDDENYSRLQYVPVRLVAYDLNHDGRDEVIVAKNTMVTTKMIHNLRSLDGGQVVCLSWDGEGLRERWQTSKYAGHVTDIAVGSSVDDIGEMMAGSSDTDEKLRLFVGHSDGGGLEDLFAPSSNETELIIYEFKIQ